MRRSFQHFRHLASFFRMSGCEFTSIQPGLIAAPAQHFFSENRPSWHFGGGRRLVKVMGETPTQKIPKNSPSSPRHGRSQRAAHKGRHRQSDPPFALPDTQRGGQR